MNIEIRLILFLLLVIVFIEYAHGEVKRSSKRRDFIDRTKALLKRIKPSSNLKKIGKNGNLDRNRWE